MEGSLLSKMLKGEVELKKIKEDVFIDRNPTVFAHVVDYLSNGLVAPPLDEQGKLSLQAELKFWGLEQEEQVVDRST